MSGMIDSQGFAANQELAQAARIAVTSVVRLREGESMTEEEVRAYCRGQIAHFKVPRHVRFVDEFPMTVTGKMQKFLMRARMEQELRGGSAG